MAERVSNMKFTKETARRAFRTCLQVAAGTIAANLAAFGMDEFQWSRRRSCAVFGVALAVLSMPCILGFNLWKRFHPLGGSSNILDLEEFVVSGNLLPLGALCLTLFCLFPWGWGEENFYEEVNAGVGWKFPRWPRHYLKWILPLLIFGIWLLTIFG